MSEVHDYASASQKVDTALWCAISAIEQLASARASHMADAPAYGRVAASKARERIAAAGKALAEAEALLREYRPKEADHG